MRLFNFIAASILCLTLAFSAKAMTVTPVVFDMDTVGREARANIRVTNTGESPLPVAITFNEARVSSTGEVTKTPAEEDFIIFPFQATIEPGETQIFRVQYLGDPDIPQSKTYIFSVAQQPVDLPDGVSGFQILYNFEVIGSITPINGKPDLSIARTDIETDKDGVRRPVVYLKNDSNTHAYLSGTRLDLQARNSAGRIVWSKRYSPQEITQTIGIGLVQPGVERRFILPVNLEESGTVVEAEIQYLGRE